jgi:hypothetical protein
MFSSLASLLPSALHINPRKQTVDPEESNKEDEEIAYSVQPQIISNHDQQMPAKGKEKDAKSPSEVGHFLSDCSSQSGSMCMNTKIMYISKFRCLLH